MEGIFSGTIGQIPAISQLESLADTLVSALEMAAGLRDATSLLAQLWTREAGAIWAVPTEPPVLSFSGGVADCIDTQIPSLQFGDIGPLLGQAIRRSRLCQEEYRLGDQTIRATVIGAGCHSAQLSGSTVFCGGITLPEKNLPVVVLDDREQESEAL